MNELKIPTKEETLKTCKEMKAGPGYHALFLYLLTKRIKEFNNCKTIVEIGVDRGEAAYAMLKVIPDAKYYGFDSWKGAWKLAQPYHKDMTEELLDGFDVTLTQISSYDLKEIPMADLIHVDGDHSVEGATHDVELVQDYLNQRGVIIVHDMIYPTVKEAIMVWYRKNKDKFNIGFYDCGNEWAVIWRK